MASSIRGTMHFVNMKGRPLCSLRAGDTLHQDAFVIDGHSDILLPVVDGVTTLSEPWPESERSAGKD